MVNPRLRVLLVEDSENDAVAILKAGAHDFVTKQNLARLGPAVARGLHEAKNRAEHRETTMLLAAIVGSSDDAIISVNCRRS